ncbi:MAG: mandelate racemase [Candidatus Entotheonella factor]|uniref:Mandelate racemase n=1 Tax=Entotheonella factor TaxID=1429438 RepID=W4LQN0_ENTF1|nr:mandelate racemase/muconate lactonizing enzyme family protein [Candidatus Entotheonella palauensis]ETX00041.1 MAG: mandelate racemase [Candidatus Entotheonella factor]
MKITDVTLQGYAWPRVKPIRNGKYTYTTVGLNLIHVHTDDGITGVGWGGGPAFGRPAELTQAFVDHFKPALVGEDPLCYRRLWHRMWEPKIVGRRGMSTQTISAIDIALWDLAGKALGQPIYKLLGAYTDRIPAYIAGGYYEEGKGLKELAEEMETNLELNAKAIKMKIGGAPIREDVERVRVVRETIGPDVHLLVDANNAYTAYQAIDIARKLEPYDIFWFEEPVAPDDYRGHAQVTRSTSIPVATGENEYTRYGFRDLIAHEAAHILNPDAQILGGITEFMHVASLAAAHDLQIAPHGAQEVHIHLVAAIPNGLILEVYRETVDPLRSQIFKERLALDEDGYVVAPDRPGLGVEPNYDLLQQYRVA